MKYKFKHKDIEATISCTSKTISKLEFERLCKSLLCHLVASIEAAAFPGLSARVSAMRYKFLEDVLKTMVEEAHNSDCPIPEAIKRELSKGVKVEWDPNDPI